MMCHTGGLPVYQQFVITKLIRDITTLHVLTHLKSSYHNVTTEPQLQPINGEYMLARSANTDDGARADIRARGFWYVSQDAFFCCKGILPKHTLESFN